MHCTGYTPPPVAGAQQRRECHAALSASADFLLDLFRDRGRAKPKTNHSSKEAGERQLPRAGRGAAGEAVRLSRDLRFAAQRLHRRARASTRARRRCFSVAKAYSSTRAAISLHPKTNSLAAPFSGGSKDSIPICKPFSAARGSSRRLSLAAGKVPELFIAPWHTFWEV